MSQKLRFLGIVAVLMLKKQSQRNQELLRYERNPWPSVATEPPNTSYSFLEWGYNATYLPKHSEVLELLERKRRKNFGCRKECGCCKKSRGNPLVGERVEGL
jgi:hypothetical protein